MDLKTFKTGVESLARMTNQRQADPAPFVVQVGADRMLSLIAGDEQSTLVWRTGVEILNSGRLREPIRSKTLVQSTKVLKGKDTRIGFEITDKALVLNVFPNGGRLELAYGNEMPKLFRVGVELGIGCTIPASNLDTYSRAFEICNDSWYNYAQIDKNGRLSGTDSFKIYESKLPIELPEVAAVPASFWNALRGATNDGEATFYSNGLRVRLNSFEASTGFVAVRQYLPDMRREYFPDGYRADVFFVADRKQLIGNLKAVGDNNREAQARFIRDDDGVVTAKGLSTEDSVQIRTIRGKGTGRVSFSTKFVVEILNAMSGKEVIVEYQTRGVKPLLFTDTSAQHGTFLLAPVNRP